MEASGAASPCAPRIGGAQGWRPLASYCSVRQQLSARTLQLVVHPLPQPLEQVVHEVPVMSFAVRWYCQVAVPAPVVSVHVKTPGSNVAGPAQDGAHVWQREQFWLESAQFSQSSQTTMRRTPPGPQMQPLAS